MLHPLNHGPNPNIPQLCSHCYPFSYNDCSRRVWTSRKDLFKKYGEIFEMFIEKMMVNPPYTWDASLFGPSQNRMQSSWPALQRRGLHTPWPCLPGMRSRRGCMRLKKITLITSCNCISFTKCKAKLRQKINHMIKIYIIWLRPTRIYIYIREQILLTTDTEIIRMAAMGIASQLPKIEWSGTHKWLWQLTFNFKMDVGQTIVTPIKIGEDCVDHNFN